LILTLLDDAYRVVEYMQADEALIRRMLSQSWSSEPSENGEPNTPSAIGSAGATLSTLRRAGSSTSTNGSSAATMEDAEEKAGEVV